MSALPDRYEDDSIARLELRALERMVSALCADTERLIRQAGEHGRLGSREADLQSEAFAERREQARALLGTASSEPYEIRITRLEKTVEALTSSREFFLAMT